MRISKRTFDSLTFEGKLKIAFIGMSNVGKTKISKMLAAKGGFNRYEVDAAIGKKLALASITSVASWMGFPSSPTYSEREAEYIAYEAECTLEGVRDLAPHAVLDTTGSVIYLPDAVLKELKKQWLIVYIQSQESDVEEMFSVFMKEPKPVIWGGMFSQHPEESTEDALKRCYPELLKERMKRYKALADVTVNRFALYKAKTVEDILSVIKNAL